MNKFVGLITASDHILKDYNTQKDLFEYLSKKFKKFYILDLNYFKLFNRNTQKNLKLPKNIKYIFPKSYSELIKIFKNKNFIAFDGGIKNEYGFSINFYLIYILLKYLRVKLVLLQNLGEIPNKKTDPIYSIKDRSRKYRIKINYLIFRVLCIIRIFPSIELYLSSDRKILNFIKTRFITYKLKKIFPSFNLSYYKNIAYVPDRELKNTNIQKYLVFVDSGFYHPDRSKRGDTPTKIDEQNYFDKMNHIFSLFKKKLKKEIVICLHPHSDLKLYKIKFKKFKVTKFNSYYFIARSKLCIFHASSLIYDAKNMGKNIVILKTNSLGKYWNFRTKNILDNDKFNNIDLDNLNNNQKKNINYVLKICKKNKVEL